MMPPPENPMMPPVFRTTHEKALEMAKDLIDKGQMGPWSTETTAIWLACDGKCIYCGRDLLQDRGIAYHFSNRDHILPVSARPDLVDEPTNWVLSCTGCNKEKRDWDPSGGSVQPDFPGPLSEQMRADYVRAAREHLARKLPDNKASFTTEKKLLLEALGRESA